MRRLITLALAISFAVIQSMNASEILPAMLLSENPANLMEQILCPSGTFSMAEARQLLSQLKIEVKTRYDIDLNLGLIIEETMKTMLQVNQFSEAEIAAACAFYSQLIEQDEGETRSASAWKWGKKKHKDKSRHKKGQELILPNKMAAGYMCMLGGALLCLLPFGVTQTLGGGLILGGVSLIFTGSSEGEKPCYVDTETGQATPIQFPDSGQHLGVGKQF